MIKNTKCIAYNANYETVSKIIGYSNKGPIYHETDEIVTEYCSAKNSYNFDCKDCPFAKTLSDKGD